MVSERRHKIWRHFAFTRHKTVVPAKQTCIYLRDSVLLWQQLWRFLSSGMWRRIVQYKFTEASVNLNQNSQHYIILWCCVNYRCYTLLNELLHLAELRSVSLSWPVLMHWPTVWRKWRKIVTPRIAGLWTAFKSVPQSWIFWRFL
jgi:hypothetical protein